MSPKSHFHCTYFSLIELPFWYIINAPPFSFQALTYQAFLLTPNSQIRDHVVVVLSQDTSLPSLILGVFLYVV